jgi:hypothetical protein
MIGSGTDLYLLLMIVTTFIRYVLLGVNLAPLSTNGGRKTPLNVGNSLSLRYFSPIEDIK